MAITIKVAVYTNSDDAFVAWAPSDFIAGCRGFLLERARKTASGEKVEAVENRVGFSKDNPKSGEHRPSNEWPFQRFNWTDHAVDVGNQVRFRVTAMIDDGSRSFQERSGQQLDSLGQAYARRRRRILVLLQSWPGAVAIRCQISQTKTLEPGKVQSATQEECRSKIPFVSRRRSGRQAV